MMERELRRRGVHIGLRVVSMIGSSQQANLKHEHFRAET